MKKLIGTVVAAALLATAAFAEVNVGMGFNKALFVPFGYDGSDIYTYQCVSFGGAPRVGVSFSASSEQAGVAADIKFDGGNVVVNDNAYLWVKPWDFLTLKAGQWFDDTLRGGLGFGIDGWLQGSCCHTNDLTFARIYNTANGKPVFGDSTWDAMRGVEIALTPIEGLYIAVGLNTGYTAYATGTDSCANKNSYNVEKIGDVFKISQYQVGYTIADTATIKAQYIGQGDYGWINAAVDLLMIENQKISLGAYIPTDSAKAANEQVGIGATYDGSFDALSLKGYVLFDMVKDTKNEIDVAVGVGYDLGDGLAVAGDVRLDVTMPKVGDASLALNASVGLTKGLSNGMIGIAAQIAVPLSSGGSVKMQGLTGAADKVVFALPIVLQVGF